MPVDEFASWNKDNVVSKAVEKANYVSITGNAMQKFINKKHKIIPNGADFNHFNKAINKLRKPSDFPNVGDKLIIGYYGAHAVWVDFELIKKIANVESVHVVMIGKMADKDYNLSFQHKNVTWLGLKPYDELPYYLSHFDICMIPFKLTDMISGCDPIKFYENCSAGKPVMATRMIELNKYKEVVYFMDHHNYIDVIEQVKVGLGDRELVNKRINLAKSNSWDIRAKNLLDMIG